MVDLSQKSLTADAIVRDRESFFVGVYRDNRSKEHVGRQFYYSFAGRRTEDFHSGIGCSYNVGLRLVRKPLPILPDWEKSMLEHFDKHLLDAGKLLAPVGYMQVNIVRRESGIVAITDMYFPKRYLKEDAAPGLGYATEWIVLSSLKGQVTHVSTSIAPEGRRIGQLERVDLPINQAVPIDEWMSGLLRGLRLSIKKNRRL